MRKRKITDGQLEMAAELRKQKLSLSEISQQIGISTAALSLWLKRMEDEGTIEHTDLRRVDRETVEEVLKLRRQNLTYNKIAQRTGKSISSVAHICNQWKVKATNRTYRKPAGRPKKK